MASRSRRLIGQIARFGVSTGFSATLSFGLPIMLHELLGVSETVAVAIGFATAYVGNIMLLRNYVFRSKGDWRNQTIRYMLSNGAFRLAEYGAFLFLFEHLGLDYRLSVFAVLAVFAVIKFFVYRLVFTSGRRSPPEV